MHFLSTCFYHALVSTYHALILITSNHTPDNQHLSCTCPALTLVVDTLEVSGFDARFSNLVGELLFDSGAFWRVRMCMSRCSTGQVTVVVSLVR